MRSIILSILILTVSSLSYADTDKSSNYSIYVAGLLYHFDTAPENNDGNMEYLALSRDFQKGNWLFETGAGTYLDSYYKRSYLIFSNITHSRFKKKWVSLMISPTCTYKGKELKSNKRETICAPLPKIRIGKDKGLFANMTYTPKYKDVTNGFIGIELGYKF